MTYPSDPAAPAPRPGTPDGAWAPPQGGASAAAPEDQQKSGAKKWLGIGGAVLAAAVVGLGSLTGWFGAGDPEVGDCVQSSGESDVEVVDCDAPEAQFRIVGIDEQEMTRSEFDAASIEDLCVDFAETEGALWFGDLMTEPGTIYCAAAI
ncbi:LppU/SCO3897 family protein [Blastococcus tunisiensis]|uniref:Uncharacterized protein n=1 Tax=Blastococcus tunisiensis TaxID=1798228 RepID=A0A1I2LJ72_9ACTN|nr:hypothetical protein [Blastococcus sp. DSM 46838]SFF77487.1 hypothetical protein SAMN05216574_12658 [Blastococcus sp. DSM 46838]